MDGGACTQRRARPKACGLPEGLPEGVSGGQPEGSPAMSPCFVSLDSQPRRLQLSPLTDYSHALAPSASLHNQNRRIHLLKLSPRLV